MSDKHPTPMLDELETGPWPSFVSGIKRLRDNHDPVRRPRADSPRPHREIPPRRFGTKSQTNSKMQTPNSNIFEN